MPSRPASYKPRQAKAPRHVRPEADRQATRALNTGSKAWRLLRDQVLARDAYRCQACQRLVTGKDAHVDHIDNDAHQHVTLDRLWLLCSSCHASKTRTTQNGATWRGPKGGVDP